MTSPAEGELSTQGGAATTRAPQVVLFEQSQLSRTFLTRLFTGLGLRCRQTDSRDEAVGLILGGRPDLICMNAWIGDVSALDFVPELRASGCTAPILLLTARSGERFVTRAREAGVTEVIGKRASGELADQIRDFVQRHIRGPRQRGRILYVEDSRTEAVVIKTHLEQMGFLVDHFLSAEDAITRLKGCGDYDLLITDVLLKGSLGGLGLIDHVRKLPEPLSRTPILTLTGFDEAPRRLEILRAGTNDYVVKPVLPEELSVRVNNLISNKLLLDRVIQQQAQLREMALTDQLTGCLNRRGLYELLRRHVAQRRRQGLESEDALLILDLDHFKQLNDRYGHATGDRVLAAVGECLRSICRDGDILCRSGGEEFVLLLPEVPRQRLRSTAERICRSIRACTPGGLQISASIGATCMVLQESEEFDEHLNRADQALYRAKQRGRDRVAVLNPPRRSH